MCYHLLDHLELAGRYPEAIDLLWRLPWLMYSLRTKRFRLFLDDIKKRVFENLEVVGVKNGNRTCQVPGGSAMWAMLTEGDVDGSKKREKRYLKFLFEALRLGAPTLQMTNSDPDSQLCLQIFGRLADLVRDTRAINSHLPNLVSECSEWMRAERGVTPVVWKLQSPGGALETVLRHRRGVLAGGLAQY